MPILGSVMTDWGVMSLGALLASILLATAAQAGMADRLAAYVAGCEAAILRGDISAFSDLAIETETITDSVTVLGWRGSEEGGLTASLLVRKAATRRSGVCDISYHPLDRSTANLAEITDLIEEMAVNAMAKETSRVEMTEGGQVILTCSGTRGMALYLDPDARGSGFTAQVATMPPHRLKCDG